MSNQTSLVKHVAFRFSKCAAPAVQVKPADELAEIFSELSDVLEAAAAMSSPSNARRDVTQELEQLRERLKIPASNGRKSDGEWAGLTLTLRWRGKLKARLSHGGAASVSGSLQTLSLPLAKCYTFHWEKDNFGTFWFRHLVLLTVFSANHRPPTLLTLCISTATGNVAIATFVYVKWIDLIALWQSWWSIISSLVTVMFWIHLATITIWIIFNYLFQLLWFF